MESLHWEHNQKASAKSPFSCAVLHANLCIRMVAPLAFGTDRCFAERVCPDFTVE